MSGPHPETYELIDEFVARATGQRSPGYRWKGQAIEAANAVLDAINAMPKVKLADAIHVDTSLPGNSRAAYIERLLEGLAGIEKRHRVRAALVTSSDGYALAFRP